MFKVVFVVLYQLQDTVTSSQNNVSFDPHSKHQTHQTDGRNSQSTESEMRKCKFIQSVFYSLTHGGVRRYCPSWVVTSSFSVFCFLSEQVRMKPQTLSPPFKSTDKECEHFGVFNFKIIIPDIWMSQTRKKSLSSFTAWSNITLDSERLIKKIVSAKINQMLHQTTPVWDFLQWKSDKDVFPSWPSLSFPKRTKRKWIRLPSSTLWSLHGNLCFHKV